MLTLVSGNEAWRSQLQRLDRFVTEFRRHLSLDWDLLLYPFLLLSSLSAYGKAQVLSRLFPSLGPFKCTCKGASKFPVLPLAFCRLLRWQRMWWIRWDLCLKNPSFDPLFTQSPGTQHKPKTRLILNSNEPAQKERVICFLPSHNNFSPDEGFHTKYNRRKNYFSCVPVVFLTNICVCLFLDYKMQLLCSLKYTSEIKNTLSQLAA